MHFYDLWKNTKGLRFKNSKKADFRINIKLYFVNSDDFKFLKFSFVFPLPPPKNIRAYWNKNIKVKRGKTKEPTT